MSGAIVSLLVVTVAFLGLVIWVLLPGSRDLQRHADIPFIDDDKPYGTTVAQAGEEVRK